MIFIIKFGQYSCDVSINLLARHKSKSTLNYNILLEA